MSAISKSRALAACAVVLLAAPAIAAMPATTASYYSDPSPSASTVGDEIVLTKELTAWPRFWNHPWYPHYGARDGRSDIVYATQSATWHFSLPPGARGDLLVRIFAIAEDDYQEPEGQSLIRAWINDQVVDETQLPHGVPYAKTFTNWVTLDYPIDQRGPRLDVGLEAFGQGWVGVDAIQVIFKPANQPPDCSGAAPSETEISPPNHKMVSVTVAGVTDPDGDPVAVSVRSIIQDEPLDDEGDGSTGPDATIRSGAGFEVRAERSGTGDGRVYLVNVAAEDDKGASCDAWVRIGVPHDQKHAPVLGDERYDSTVG